MSEQTVVVLIHGIRTSGWWGSRVAVTFERKTSATVIPLKYGYFDLLRFLCPFRICRNGPIERLRREIEGIRQKYPDARLIVFAHSFGTYALSKILLENPYFKFNRVILCGSIIAEKFDWRRVEDQILATNKRDGIINECGLRDVWPVLAKSLSFGYGASGTYGFGAFNVRDRFHPNRHSDFFEPDFVDRYWVPILKGDHVDFSESDAKGEGAPWWFGLFRPLLIWPFAVLLSILIFMLATPPPVPCPSRVLHAASEQKGNNGGLYRVQADFTRGREKLDSRACGREYWIALEPGNDLSGQKWVYLLDSESKRLPGSYLVNPDDTLRLTNQ
jgi:pimeloyl-ACP methyl ester carboxylesterase